MPGKLFHTWQCDCAYRQEQDRLAPDGLIADICRAREWDEGCLCYRVTVANA
jgi:hypothetical protein